VAALSGIASEAISPGEIDLYGQNFTSSSQVLLDGSPILTFFESSTELSLTYYAVPSGTHTLQVQDPTYGKSAILSFTVYRPEPGPDVFRAHKSTYVSDEIDPIGVVADFNGDGLGDVALLGGDTAGNEALYIFFGQSDGNFTGPNTIPWSGGFTALVTGDLNGDGYPDLIVTNNLPSANMQYWTLINDGKGNFVQKDAGSFGSAGFQAGTPVLADFRQSGHLDMIFPAWDGSGEFYFLPGNGDGTFGLPQPLPGFPGANCTQLAVGDLNGDGLPDLVCDATTYPAGEEVRVLMNDGNAKFHETRPTALIGRTGPFLLADFNNDHKLDLLISQVPRGFQFFVLWGQGDGTFVDGPSFSAGAYGPAAFSGTGDFDGDGNLDLVTSTSSNGPWQTVILWGDGQGGFTPQYLVGEAGNSQLAGDSNGDGVSDLIELEDSYFLGWTLGQKDRQFDSPAYVQTPSQGFISAADALGDGYQDLFVSGTVTMDGSFPGSIFHVQPDGSFRQIGSAPPNGVLLADLDGDGIADLLGFEGYDLMIWKGNGSGDYSSLAPAYRIPVHGNPNVVVRDMDGDGWPDIVVGDMILYGKGGMDFEPVQLPTSDVQPVAVGDFDGDGLLDIATPTGIMFGLGNRRFTTRTGSIPKSMAWGVGNPSIYGNPSAPTWAVADLNRDGKDDIVTPGLEIFLGTGRAGFVLDQVLETGGSNIGSINVADFNGDGRLEILATTLDGEAMLFTNDGKGGYLLSSFSPGVQSIGGIVADFNHDGKPDLAVQNFVLNYRPTNSVIVLHK
jgi:hypothetical protein